jgi:hypothetical protein
VRMNFVNFESAISVSLKQLQKFGEDVDTGTWQGVSTVGKPDMVTRELLDLGFNVNLERAAMAGDTAAWIDQIAQEIKPNLPWADEHFAERVGGIPRNPDPSHVHWPWWHGQDDETKQGGVFTHTYSERFWPTVDGHPGGPNPRGIRFRYGDYNDVLDLLRREPYTRQAYLPIFFPEDTGAVHGGRIPCSLGYHFLLRGNQFHCWYEIRSCDAVRHFRDDLYLAARLVAHTLSELFEHELRSDDKQVWVDVNPGKLLFSCHSFHVHKGDAHLL